MKVVVFSESSADEAAVRILVEGILGKETELASSTPPIRSRGWAAVLRDLPMLVRHLHYRTDAFGLVAVVDSNRSPVHRLSDCQSAEGGSKCRLCQMGAIVARVQRSLPARPE